MRRTAWHRVAPALVLLLVPALLLGCGDDDDEPPETATPTLTATAEPETPTPTATSTPEPEPTPIPLDPELPADAVELGDGTRNLTLEAGVPFDLDPLQAASEADVELPACAAFVFAFAWGADGPGAEGLVIEGLRQGVTNELGTGPSGEVTTGCVLLRFTAPDAASVDISFLVGELQ